MEKIKNLTKEMAVVHYARTPFNENGNEVYNFHVFQDDKYHSFIVDGSLLEESEAIESYAKLVNRIIESGTVICHWGQDNDLFGPDHINTRYKELTGRDLDLSYGPYSVNLSFELIKRFGTDYANHPRLDSIAAMNSWSNLQEKNHPSPIFDYRRTSLIVKILHAVIDGTLKVREDVDTANELLQSAIDKIRAELKLTESPESVLEKQEVVESYGIGLFRLTMLVDYNRIPYTKVGSRTYFKKSDILKVKN